jgi:hypothetical protein
MAHLIPTAFSKWELTDEEAKQGSILSIAQTQVIQNNLAMAAEEKLMLEIIPDNVSLYLQREAGLAGQIAALQFLLDQSDFWQDPANLVIENK